MIVAESYIIIIYVFGLNLCGDVPSHLPETANLVSKRSNNINCSNVAFFQFVSNSIPDVSSTLQTLKP
jgi:hypothetical protein